MPWDSDWWMPANTDLRISKERSENRKHTIMHRQCCLKPISVQAELGVSDGFFVYIPTCVSCCVIKKLSPTRRSRPAVTVTAQAV